MGLVNVRHNNRSQWISAICFCVFAIMPLGGLIHYLALRVWLAVAFSPIVLFSASLSLAQLGSSLTEYELSETAIRKKVLGRVVGVINYDAIEKVQCRTNRWCYIKGQKQTFFFVPKMMGYEESINLISSKLKSLNEYDSSES